MKRSILFLFLFTLIGNIYSQCFSITELINLSQSDAKKSEKFLTDHSFKLENSSKAEIEMIGAGWYNNQTDNYINIKTLNDTFYLLRYRLKSNEDCYNKLSSELHKHKFKKDSEKVDKYNTEYFYYSNDKYGIILSKWKAPEPNKGNFYSMELLNKKNYNDKLQK